MMDATDRIGDRLDHPENVPPELAHLIPDDIARVARILAFPVAGRVLDVGCSDGAIAKRIAEQWGVDVLGADVRIVPNPAVPMIQMDITKPVLNMAPHYFDSIYACEVFEHLTRADANLALHNICELLKPQGSLIVTVPNRTPADVYEVGCRSRWAWPDHRQGFTLASLIEFLKAGGFPIRTMEIVPLYDGEEAKDSIWLIVRARR